ncbi:Clp protease N-terminal domain-containing protein, partial [Clostridioides difficile]
ELSGMFANKLKTNYIGTEHILLAIIQEGEGIANKILNYAGVNDRTLAQLTIDMMGISDKNQYKAENSYTGNQNQAESKVLDKYGRN